MQTGIAGAASLVLATAISGQPAADPMPRPSLKGDRYNSVGWNPTNDRTTAAVPEGDEQTSARTDQIIADPKPPSTSGTIGSSS